jgi:GNAT superfamily N-acetyltransferase
VKFDRDYCEDIDLPGESKCRLRFRLIRPEDKPRLQQGLLRLSPESQYLRFFTTKPHLTSKELEYLTELDGHDHFAIVAVVLEPDGSEGSGVGVARFVRLPAERSVAEPAIVVIDDMQNRGIGSLLMSRLVEAAKERDVEVFRSEFLARNEPIKQVLAAVSPHIRYEGHGPVVTAEIPLRPTNAMVRARPEGESPFDAIVALQGVLRMVAESSVELRRRFMMLFDPEALQAAWREFRDQLMHRRDDLE